MITKFCPYCKSNSAFFNTYANQIENKCTNLYWRVLQCNNCNWLVIDYTEYSYYDDSKITISYPSIWEYITTIDTKHITDDLIKKDFEESINAYNFWLYISTCMMIRRCVHREVELKNWIWKDLYDQIQSLGISDNLKLLLQKIRIFWNSWAHPNYVLEDNNWNIIVDYKEVASLWLHFMDMYFYDKYSVSNLISKFSKTT